MTETDLSPRQREIMQCLVNGMTQKSIAVHLGIQKGTVHKYIQRVIEKTGALSLTHCVALLVFRGVVTPNSN